MNTVRAELAFDSIRVYLYDHLHIDIRRSAYRGLQAWYWNGNFKIEFTLADAKPILVEYTKRAHWLAVLDGLAALPLSGE